MKVKQQLIKDTPYKYGRKNKKKYITIHETGNTSKGANAKAHANLQSNGNSRGASWHLQVDDKEAIQSFTYDFQLWAAGDGKGDGNLNSIHIEICVNSDGDYQKAVENAAKLTKEIMEQENIPIQNVVQHNKWSGKNCPRYLRDGQKGIKWNDFINLVKKEDKPKGRPKPTDNKRWRIRTGLFKDAESYVKAIKRLEEDYGWLLHEKANSTDLNPRYRIVTGLFTGKNVAEYYAEQLREKYGWLVSVIEK